MQEIENRGMVIYEKSKDHPKIINCIDSMLKHTNEIDYVKL